LAFVAFDGTGLAAKADANLSVIRPSVRCIWWRISEDMAWSESG
jgi:hypothetical protein